MWMLRMTLACALSIAVPALVSAQDTVAPAPAADAAPPPAAATVEIAVSPAVPPPPTVYVTPSSSPMVAPTLPPPRSEPRPSFGLSIGLHVAAAVTGVIGMAGLVLGALYGFACSFGGDCTIPAVLLISGGVLESASLALGISATAVHGHTRTRAREWDEAGALAWTPIATPTTVGAGLSLRF